jgi:hypothetical protein
MGDPNQFLPAASIGSSDTPSFSPAVADSFALTRGDSPEPSGPALSAGVSLVNTAAMGPSNPLLIAFGRPGMPAAPATYQTTTGNVRVTVQAQITGTGGGGALQYFLTRDGVRVGTFFQAGVDANVGGVPNSIVLIGYDAATPGSSHAWGISVHGLNGGGSYAVEVAALNQALVTVEDV